MTAREEFWNELRAAHDTVASDVDYVAEVKRRLPSTPPARKPRRHLAWSIAAAALVGATVVLLLLLPRSESIAGTFTVGTEKAPGTVGAWIAAPDTQALPLVFSDGTQVTLHQGSRARVVQANAQGAHMIIEKGGGEAHVRHRDGSQWLVDVGPFHLRVVGTRFDVNWDATQELFRLQLFEGKVRVSGAFLKEPLSVSEGQFLTADCRQQRSELGSGAPPSSREATVGHAPPAPSAVPSQSSDGDAVGAGHGTKSPGTESKADGDNASSWQSLAASGRYREAFALLQQEGFAGACAAASAQECVQLGDVARLSGHPAEARRAYLDARRAGGGAMAAYGLGLTTFDQERNYAQAAQWFRTYLRERPGGALRREALGRLMEALRRGGDQAGARTIAAKYLNEFPNGTHASLARRLTER